MRTMITGAVLLWFGTGLMLLAALSPRAVANVPLVHTAEEHGYYSDLQRLLAELKAEPDEPRASQALEEAHEQLDVIVAATRGKEGQEKCDLCGNGIMTTLENRRL